MSCAQARFRIGNQQFESHHPPTYARVSMQNRSASSPTFSFTADDAPLQRKFNIYEVFAD
nr:J491 [uncultured bacterium]